MQQNGQISQFSSLTISIRIISLNFLIVTFVESGGKRDRYELSDRELPVGLLRFYWFIIIRFSF